ALIVEGELDPFVNESFPMKAVAHPHCGHHFYRALLQATRTDALLNVFARVRLDDDRINSLQMKQMRKEQAGGSGAHDSNLSFQEDCSTTMVLTPRVSNRPRIV